MFTVTTDALVPLTVLLLPVDVSGEFENLPIYQEVREKYPEVLTTYQEACKIGWFGVCSTLLIETTKNELPYIFLFGSKGKESRYISVVPVIESIINKFLGMCSSLDVLHDIGVVIVPSTIREGEKIADLVTEYLFGLSKGRVVYFYLQVAS
jgi:hypothetical protein